MIYLFSIQLFFILMNFLFRSFKYISIFLLKRVPKQTGRPLVLKDVIIMKNIFPAFIAILFFNIFLPSQKVNAQKKDKPVNIIFDSDMGPDYDDVGALGAGLQTCDCPLLKLAQVSRPVTVRYSPLISSWRRSPDL